MTFEFSKTVRVSEADRELSHGLAEALEEIKQLRQQVLDLSKRLHRLTPPQPVVHWPSRDGD